MRVLYFAYGSNLLQSRMKERCPSAELVCRARLPSRRLAFSRRSKDGHGVADVVEDPRYDVWGGVYRIADQDVPGLDRAEGVRLGAYERTHLTAVADPGEVRIEVEVYVVPADRKHPVGYPTSCEYKAMIVEGARAWNLPAQYMEDLDRIWVEEDLAPHS
jgi:gamma-glutamylcyclotransferase